MDRKELKGIIQALFSFAAVFSVGYTHGLLYLMGFIVFGSYIGMFKFFPLLYYIYCNFRSVGKLLHKPPEQPHSTPVEHEYEGIKVCIVPVLMDNYSYIVICQKTNKAAVIDPGDCDPVWSYLNMLNREGNGTIEVDKILITHKHWDHCGGVEELMEKFPNKKEVQVYGSEGKVDSSGQPRLVDGEKIEIGNIKVTIRSVPGHTEKHMCFEVQDEGGKKLLFTGDALFCGGCGAFFRGRLVRPQHRPQLL